MTFRQVNRSHPKPASFQGATPSNAIRLSCQRVRSHGSRLVVFWLGFEVAASLGLSDRRERVSLFIDDSKPERIIAIRTDPEGLFYASKRLGAYSVHTDSKTAEHLLGSDSFAFDTIPADDLHFSEGQVSFPFRVRDRSSGKSSQVDFNRTAEMKAAAQ